MCDNPDRINSPHLFKVINLLNRRETKASILDRGIIINLFNFRLLIKDYRVVVFDACIFLVCHFNLTVGKKVDSVLNEPVFVMISLIIEESGLDLSSLTID